MIKWIKDVFLIAKLFRWGRERRRAELEERDLRLSQIAERRREKYTRRSRTA
jgi:hypothetical protein